MPPKESPHPCEEVSGEKQPNGDRIRPHFSRSSHDCNSLSPVTTLNLSRLSFKNIFIIDFPPLFLG